MKRIIAGVLLLAMAGCATGSSSFKKGESFLSAGDYDQAVVAYAAAAEKNPDKAEYRMRLSVARHQAALAHQQKGNGLFAHQDYRGALREYQLVTGLDPSIETGREGTQEAERYIRVNEMTTEAGKLFRDRHFKQARSQIEDALALVPTYPPALALRKELDKRAHTIIDGVELQVTSDEPITLNFKAASLPDVFDILTQLSGIRFILDDAIRSQTTTLYLEDATFAQALELLLRMNKLDKKILNPRTIILYPNSNDKQKQFNDQIIQTFYLSNIDAKKAVNLLRTMLTVRKIYVHEELNAIVLRDTPEVIRLAQKILEANDRATSEVVFDLELVEVNHTKGMEIGPSLPTSFSVGLIRPGESIPSKIDSVITDNLKNLRQLYSIPPASFYLQKNKGDSEILASPKVRVKNNGKAKVHIGSREPIVTTTNNAAGDVTSTNIQYVDVGVKLDLEANIQLDNSIVTKVNLEVSNKGAEVPAGDNVAFAITTTNTTTELVLRDGEQTIIGGLLRDDVSKTKDGPPILSDIPILGALFTHYKNTKSKREILLSITPHIVRSMRLPEPDVASIWSGAEDDLRVGRNFGSFADEYVEGQGKTPANAAPGAQLHGQQVSQPTPADAVADALMEQPAAETKEPTAETPAVEAGKPAVPEVSTPVPAPAPKAEAVPTPQPVPSPHVVAPPQKAVPPAVETGVAKTPDKDQVAEVVLPGVKPPEAVVRPVLFLAGDRLTSVGKTFTLELKVQDVKALYSAPLYVRFDPRLVDFVSASEGEFLKQGRVNTIFTSTLMADSGRLIVGLKQGAGGQGVSGGGVLARLEFKAKAAGKVSIAPERINFRNPQGERLPVDSRGLVIEVK